MKNVTVEAVLSSSKFIEIATKDAIELVAKSNNQKVETTKLAFAQGAKNVQKQVAKLVFAAAEETAKRLSE